MSVTFDVDGRTYRWYGGYGTCFESFENGKRVGDTRVIDGRLYYIHTVGPKVLFKKQRVCWAHMETENNTMEFIQKLKKKLLDL